MDKFSQPALADYLKRAADIDGRCEAAFAAVEGAFRDNFKRGELGAAVTVYHRGQVVVDLWGGFQDLSQTTPWGRDTRVCAFSLNKCVTAASAHLAVYDGVLDYDAPVARYWPAFAAADKGATTVRQVLSHTAGLPGIRRPLTAAQATDWTLVGDALATQRPFWPAGAYHGYHMGTYGLLLAHLVEHVRGRPYVALFGELCARLGIDAALTVTDSADIAAFVQPQPVTIALDTSAERREMLRCVYENPPDVGGGDISGEVPLDRIAANTAGWRARLNPSVCGFWTARDMARFGLMFAGSSSPLAPELRDELLRPQVDGVDDVLGVPVCYTMGFQRWIPQRTIGPNPAGSFFAHGFGGAMLVIDDDYDFVIAYLMNAAGPRNSWLNRYNSALISAVYESLAGP
ncbi:MAG: serine hydrolase domain-containing protein [Haliangiales bacterium]